MQQSFTSNRINSVLINTREAIKLNKAEYDYFSEAYEKYANTVFRLGLVWLNSRADAEDVVSDLFVKLMEKRPVFDSGEHEKAFIIRSAINLCKDFLRKRHFRHAAYEDGILTYFDAQEDINLMEEILSLPPKYRAVIYLHYCQGYKTAEVATMLGLREGTVRSQLYRGRELLKTRLNEGGINCV